jgi:hypothetical protein
VLGKLFLNTDLTWILSQKPSHKFSKQVRPRVPLLVDGVMLLLSLISVMLLMSLLFYSRSLARAAAAGRGRGGENRSVLRWSFGDCG